MLATSAAAAPAVLIVDSIQTVFTADLEGAPGNVGQVRECAARLMRYAKESGTTVFVVGHVTKGGGIAGPKTLEHIVDTVLYFEGESTLDHRVLRATKNRFGSVDEIGVFRMSEQGLEPVANPSELFMGDRASHASGSAVTALLEGTRPLLVEIQALAAKAGFGTPQRVATGFDGRRLALLLAVLDKRAGLSFAQLDVFLNVVGGMRLQEPAGDLAVAVGAGVERLRSLVPSGRRIHRRARTRRRNSHGVAGRSTRGRGGEHGNPARVSRRARNSEARSARRRVGRRAHDSGRCSGGCSRDAVDDGSRATSASSSSRAAAARARRRRRSSSSFAGSPASPRCCTACRRSWRGPTSCRSCACCRASTPPIRRRGSFSATSIG